MFFHYLIASLLCSFSALQSMKVDDSKMYAMLELSKSCWTLTEKTQEIQQKIIKRNPDDFVHVAKHPLLCTLCKLKENNAFLWYAILNPKKFTENDFNEKKSVSLTLLLKATKEMSEYELEAKRIMEKQKSKV